MNDLRKQTRRWLMEATRAEFYDIVYQAKLTPRQTHLVYRKFIDDYSIDKIAYEMKISPEVTKRALGRAYDLIGKILLRNKLIFI